MTTVMHTLTIITTAMVTTTTTPRHDMVMSTITAIAA